MQKPQVTNDNQIVAELRQVNKEITRGIEDKIINLHRLSASKRLGEIVFFLSIYILGAFIVFQSNGILILTLVGIVLMGITINSFGILIHEGLHGLLAKNPHLNHLSSFLVGLPMMVSSTAYQVTHTNHHYELGRKLDYGTYRQHTRHPFLIWVAYFAQLTLGTFIYLAFIPFLAFKSASSRSRLFIVLEYLLIITVYFFFFSYVPTHFVLMYWFYPILVTSVLTNIRGIASHALGDIENIYLSSRTIKSSRWVSVLFLYENYHLEHHIFPSVPSYNLSELHSLIWHRLPEAVYSKSYLHFLVSFFKAALKNDLSPAGIVHPINMKD